MSRNHNAAVILAFLSTASRSAAAQLYDFCQCQQDVQSIMKETLTVNGISNETVWQYIYTGPVTGMQNDFPREDYLAVTYEGCIKLCGPKVAINDAPKALSIAATWVFSLAILLSLPWESLHRHKIRGTFEAISNWLGSPQAALTSTIFNFNQIREYYRRVKEDNFDPASWNAYYILSCVNQFDLPQDERKQKRMLDLLLYGLFRPMSTSGDADALILRKLSSTMALQLRMLRRRIVVPSLASLATYLVAFVFSIVLAFEDLGDNTTAHSLALGLLFGWLPLLVIFTIVDRNPVSADRSAELLNRWLHNVNAVRVWKISHSTNTDNIAWWKQSDAGREPVLLGRFIGQGRRVQYSGLVAAVIEATENYEFGTDITTSDTCANAVFNRMCGWRPRSRYVIAVVSLFLIQCEIMMAFIIAFNRAFKTHANN